MSRRLESINAKLQRSQNKLRTFSDAKNRLERSIERHFREIESLNDKIAQVEEQIERLVQEVAANEIRMRTKRELALIKPSYAR
ncbi:hypothetical protein Trydic_g23889 [Trypoxylus dichotomus]